MNPKGLIGAVLIVIAVGVANGQGRKAPEVVAKIAGDEVYQVLPLGAIPAIDQPTFLSGDRARAQMRLGEPVIGIVMGGEARAYSLWQLDAHEIVNDTIQGTAIAVTW
jgi:hypothetical protein